MDSQNIGGVDVDYSHVDPHTLKSICSPSAHSLHTNWGYTVRSLGFGLKVSTKQDGSHDINGAYHSDILSLEGDLSFQNKTTLNPQFSIAGNKGIISKAIHHLLEINNYIALHACAVFSPETGKTIVGIGASGSGKTALISVALRNGWKIVSTEMLVVSSDSIFMPGNTLDTVSPRAADYIEKYLDGVSVNRGSIIKDETGQKCLADFTSAHYSHPISTEDGEVEIIFLNYGDVKFSQGKTPTDTDYITRMLQISASEKIESPTIVGNNLIDISLRGDTRVRNEGIKKIQNGKYKFTILGGDINDFERYISPTVVPKMNIGGVNETQNVSISEVEKSVENFFLKNGYSQVASTSMADNIVQAELFGRTTHGLVRIPWIIVNKIPDGSYSDLVKSGDNVFSADCAEKNGYLCCDLAIESLLNFLSQSGGSEFGVAILKSVFPSGILARYLKRFYEKKMIGFIIGTTPKLVSDNNLIPRVFGTNPIGYTFPLEGKSPIIADFSTSEMTLGKMLEFKQKGEKKLRSPKILNQNGNLTDKIHEAFSEEGGFVGSLIPFGGIESMHKGMMISLLIEIVTTFLSGNRSEKGDLVVVGLKTDAKICGKGLVGVNELIKGIQAKGGLSRTPGENALKMYTKNINSGIVSVPKNIAEILAL